MLAYFAKLIKLIQLKKNHYPRSICSVIIVYTITEIMFKNMLMFIEYYRKISKTLYPVEGKKRLLNNRTSIVIKYLLWNRNVLIPLSIGGPISCLKFTIYKGMLMNLFNNSSVVYLTILNTGINCKVQLDFK